MTNRKKILLIDDEQINLDFFDLMLARFGYTVFRAANGKEGLDLIRLHNPDLILLDNIMPEITGWDVIRQLKNSPDYKQWKDIPVIMFSALSDAQNKIQGYNLGIEDYIVKPFNFGEVLARIKSVLKTNELTRELQNIRKELKDEKKQRHRCEKTVDEIAQLLRQASLSLGKDKGSKHVFDLSLKKISDITEEGDEKAAAVKAEFLKNELDNSFESLSKI